MSTNLLDLSEKIDALTVGKVESPYRGEPIRFMEQHGWREQT